MANVALPKTYDFKSTEQRLYQWWEENGFFKPWNDPNRPGFDPSVRPFVISIPPPNVTGELHQGHAMFVSIEDLMIRYQRMRGVPTLWVPGSDHAGIATQLQVERELLRTEEVTREELGREQFLERSWQWKAKYGGIIYRQLRRLGASCDWDRERFTLDEGLSRAVREAFVRLYEKGLIYRGTYLINWSPGLRTAVSDLEVEYSEEPGTLYFFKYRLAGRDEHIPVATVRPETILGDTAVAVHPEDERYRHLIGQTALVPILDRPIPVIADTAVDREFATGALKITPGHDPTDYEIAQRHGLEIISVMNPDATLNANAGRYAGLDRFEARKKLWADMQAAGLTIKSEPYTLNVPRSQRGGEIVEPMISTQWFVRIRPLADAALAAVRDGRIRIVPERFSKVYYNWLDNIRDWCISRQLWWGHRIPVWYAPDGSMFCARTEEAAYQAARTQLGPDVTLEQDADVLDTWFSSGLWPFSTLGWPEPTPDLGYFYPTSVLETGYDILFFWVARMIMFGLEFTGQPPFHTVYLHGLVRDEQGRKMSKTIGNVVDPLVVMDQYGTDALRFTLLTGSTPGGDMNLSLERVAANRNFANKIWNATRFVLSNLGEDSRDWRLEIETPISNLPLPDRWILSRLNRTIADVTRLFDEYQYGQAGTLAYEFLWGDYCDWYLESSKRALAAGDEAARSRVRSVLLHVLDQTLRLLHPFIPFVTEELWQHLPAPAGAEGQWPRALIVAPWPAGGPTDAAAERDFGLVMDIVRGIRNVRAQYNVKPAQRIAATLVGGQETGLLQSQRELLMTLAGLEDTQFRILETLPEKPRQASALVVQSVECYLPLAGLVDLEAERARLGKELADVERQIARSEGLLASDFIRKAPPAVVEKERSRLAGLKEAQSRLLSASATLRSNEALSDPP
jgi:valyl-tRNA synthetase